MENLYTKINQAKEELGTQAAAIIATELPIENWNAEKLSGKSPFNPNDNNPSFIWNAKDNCFKDFSTGKNYGIIDFYMDKYGYSFVTAAKKLFELVDMEFSDDEFSFMKSSKKDFFENYRYPREENNGNRDKVNKYLAKRSISSETLDYMGVKEDSHGNIVFELRDINDKLLAVKYRPARAINKGEPKMWWQKDADMCPSLYNINKIDITQPLVICEGFPDCLSIVEAGYRNVVSIPGGAEDLSWIEFNYDFLDSINEIILWFDNDKAGQGGLQKAVSRLGEGKCKIVKPTSIDEDDVEKYYKQYNENLSIRKTDANNILIACGKNEVIRLINTAEEIPLRNIIDLVDIEEFDINKVEYTPTGFADLDRKLYGYIDGTVNAWTAYSGCVDCDTEFFNGREWKRISDWKSGDKVLQYNEDGTVELVTPLAYHKYVCDELWEIKDNQNHNQCLSDEHTVIVLSDDGSLKKIPFLCVRQEYYKDHKSFDYSFISYADCGGAPLVYRMNSETGVTISKYLPVDGYKYCFTVPSHMWVMRRHSCVTVTGNCGKSTLLTQSCVLEAVDRGESVFWFNAESTPSQMLNWILAQAAGREHTIEFTNDNGFKYYKPTTQASSKIKQVYKNKILVYDNLLLTNPEDVLNEMKNVYTRRGTKIFILDNWLCLNFQAGREEDISSVQLSFLNKLIQFTKKNGLQVHIVSHPRKPQTGVPLSMYDILGTSNFVNLMDRIFGLDFPHDKKIKEAGYDRQLTVFKDRVLGEAEYCMGLNYDKATRRLTGMSDNKFRRYNWDDGSIKYNSEQFGENGWLVGKRVLDDIDTVKECPY